MPAIEYFDEDRHAKSNGFGDDERDFDLYGMPPSPTEAELEDMAAAMATECETCGGFGVLHTDCDVFDGVEACPDCTVPELEPGIPFIAGVLQKRLRDLEIDKATARRNSQDWLLVNAQIGVLQSVAHELAA